MSKKKNVQVWEYYTAGELSGWSGKYDFLECCPCNIIWKRYTRGRRPKKCQVCGGDLSVVQLGVEKLGEES